MMNVNSSSLSHIPMYSRIEHTEKVRSLPFRQKILYKVIFVLMTLGGFMLAVGLLALATVIVFSMIAGEQLNMDAILVTLLPILVVFMTAVGMSGNPAKEVVTVGDTVLNRFRGKTMESLFTGFVCGVIFGVMWGFLIRLQEIYLQAFPQSVKPEVALDQVIITCVAIALVIAPVFAIFQGFSSVIGHLALHLAAPKETLRNA
jgi:hypothetical protein